MGRAWLRSNSSIFQILRCSACSREEADQSWKPGPTRSRSLVCVHQAQTDIWPRKELLVVSWPFAAVIQTTSCQHRRPEELHRVQLVETGMGINKGASRCKGNKTPSGVLIKPTSNGFQSPKDDPGTARVFADSWASPSSSFSRVVKAVPGFGRQSASLGVQDSICIRQQSLLSPPSPLSACLSFRTPSSKPQEFV